MSELTQTVVKEITVEAQQKGWSSGFNQGSSGGTNISWTVVPIRQDRAWSYQEAKKITLVVRKELEKLQIADGAARGVIDMEASKGILDQYDVAIKAVGGNNGAEVEEKPRPEASDQETASV